MEDGHKEGYAVGYSTGWDEGFVMGVQKGGQIGSEVSNITIMNDSKLQLVIAFSFNEEEILLYVISA